MAKIDLKKFRHDISVLKKQGLIGGADFRTQSAQPFMIRGGKRLDEYIKKYDDVLSGKATAVKLPPEETARRRRLGQEIARPKDKPARVIIPHAATEKITARGSVVKRSHPKGIHTVEIPADPERLLLEKDGGLRAYLNKLKKTRVSKSGRKYFVFNFFGNQSKGYYTTLAHLIEDLERYNSVEHAINHNSAKEMMDVYQNIEIVTIDSVADWRAAAPPKFVRKTDTKKAYRKRQRKLALAPEYAQEAHRENQNRRMREYREKIRANPKKDKQYKTDAKKRAKKSRKK